MAADCTAASLASDILFSETRYITMSQSKKTYRAPSLTKYGDVEQITAGNSSGLFLDQDFPDGTPADDITFSSTQ